MPFSIGFVFIWIFMSSVDKFLTPHVSYKPFSSPAQIVRSSWLEVAHRHVVFFCRTWTLACRSWPNKIVQRFYIASNIVSNQCALEIDLLTRWPWVICRFSISSHNTGFIHSQTRWFSASHGCRTQIRWEAERFFQPNDCDIVGGKPTSQFLLVQLVNGNTWRVWFQVETRQMVRKYNSFVDALRMLQFRTDLAIKFKDDQIICR